MTKVRCDDPTDPDHQTTQHPTPQHHPSLLSPSLSVALPLCRERSSRRTVTVPLTMTSRILFTTIGALLLFATTTGAVDNDQQYQNEMMQAGCEAPPGGTFHPAEQAGQPARCMPHDCAIHYASVRTLVETKHSGVVGVVLLVLTFPVWRGDGDGAEMVAMGWVVGEGVCDRAPPRTHTRTLH